jgi:large repetitive protein
MEKKITLLKLVVLSLFLLVVPTTVYAQVYQHDFGTTAISTHPYTVAPAVLNSNLSGSSWSNSTGTWSSFSGSAGQAITLANSSGTPTITLTFTVAAGKQLEISSFSFWRQRSNTGAQNWSLSIGGINVGSGTVPTSGANIGNTTVALPVSGLTGTVTAVLSLSGATGNGTLRLDDFTLNGAVTSTCTPPVITSVYQASGPSNTLVTITGSGFQSGTGTSAVNFNGVASTGFTVVSDTQIKAIVPVTATTGAITVVSNNCEGIAGTFTIVNSDCPSTTGPTELFISEVYDADAGEGGAVEIYNGTGATVNLAQYSLTRYGDYTSSSASWTVTLSGSLATGQTYIARTTTAVCGLTGTPATALQTGFNENDAFELKKNGTVIDRVEFPDETGYTFIRTPGAAAPSATYVASQWNISLVESCANLGIHSITTSPSTHISAQPLSAAICEGEAVTYTVTIDNATGITYQWKMLNDAGVWVNITNNDVFSGATTAALTITDAPIELNGAQFYCQVLTTIPCNLISNAVQLTVSPLPVAIVTIVNPTCVTTTGSIVIIPSIGDGLTYSLNGTTYQASPLYSGLTPGDYTLYVKSSADCVAQIPFTIQTAPSLPAVADVTVTQPGCGQTAGSITINSPLEPGLTYSFNGTDFQSGTTFSNLAPGTYTVTVMTALGCTSVTANITINAVPTAPAVATVTTVQPTCTTPTGTITVTAPTGTGISYSINGGTSWQTGTVFAGLAPGTYTVTTQNTDGCTSVTANITINAVPAAPAVATVTTAQPTCTTPTGTITVTAPTGTGISYSINGGTSWQTGTVFAGLAPGTYTVTTQNTDGCTSVTANITINAVPTAPAVATLTTVQPTCTTPTGTITVTAPTGTGISYSINGGTSWQAGTVFAGLAPGTYTVTTQNTDGCTSVSANITINAVPAAPATATFTVTQPTCIAAGIITVTAPVGTGYTYSINGGTTYQSGTVFSGLTQGTYTITTQNAAGCTSVTAPIIIDAVPAPPAAPVVTVIQPNCSTISKGSITVTSPTGASYTYSIDGTTWQTTTTFTNLNAGTYTVTVQNASGCTASTTVTINTGGTSPAVATTTVTPLTCTTNTGSITVNAPLGAEYTYSIDGGTTYQPGATFAGLTPGAYQIMVMNAGGCTSTTSQITVAPSPVPAEAQTVITQPTCFDNQGTVVITAPNGSGYTYSINGTNFQNGTTFINLNPGTYTVTVSNLSGCTSTTQVVINEAPVTPSAPVTSVTAPTCDSNGGVITVTSPTGSQYTYSIDGTNYQASATFSALAPGSYTVTVMSSGGCTTQGTPVVINEATGTLNIAASEGCEEMADGTNHYILHAMAQNGSFDENNVNYIWTNEAGIVVGTDSTFDATAYTNNNDFDASDYPLQFLVTISTAGGCTGVAQYVVNGTFCDVPKGVSPNNDGKNDNFDISGMNATKVSIFNRYGQEIYSMANYTNQWHGQDKGGDAPSGTYYYVIEMPGGTKTGWVYLNRENE